MLGVYWASYLGNFVVYSGGVTMWNFLGWLTVYALLKIRREGQAPISSQGAAPLSDTAFAVISFIIFGIFWCLGLAVIWIIWSLL